MLGSHLINVLLSVKEEGGNNRILTQKKLYLAPPYFLPIFEIASAKIELKLRQLYCVCVRTRKGLQKNKVSLGMD